MNVLLICGGGEQTANKNSHGVRFVFFSMRKFNNVNQDSE